MQKKKYEDYNIRILVACEESQVVTIELRKLGIEAYSCDILPCSGGHPEWHFQEDVRSILGTQKFDGLIAFPPCTDLVVCGARYFKEKIADGRQQKAIDFFRMFVDNREVRFSAVENPIGIMSTKYRKPNQIIQPFMFGDTFSKKTCLWLFNLPKLKPTNLVGKGEHYTYKSGRRMPKWYADAFKLPPKERARVRSRTFPGIAKAMAEQWGEYIAKNM